MWGWLQSLPSRLFAARPRIPQDLWQLTLNNYPFLAQEENSDAPRLRQLCELFLHEKEFHGSNGLVVTDEIALAIAAQACLPILNFGPPAQALAWYDDFVGIVVHPGEVLAWRETTDEAGVAHHHQEILVGEAMDGGPIMLSWQDVHAAGQSAERGYNVVIHEFTHKLDLRDGQADGCPALWPGFMGATSVRQARSLWLATIELNYRQFQEQVTRAQRFGAAEPWLDSYASESIDEFFAVTSEAFHVSRQRFTQEFPTLLPLFHAFFNPGTRH